MARIAGVNIPTGKRVEIALTYIHGIGRTSASKICDNVDIPRERRVSDLTDSELSRIRDTIDKEFQVEGELKREIPEPMPHLLTNSSSKNTSNEPMNNCETMMAFAHPWPKSLTRAGDASRNP